MWVVLRLSEILEACKDNRLPVEPSKFLLVHENWSRLALPFHFTFGGVTVSEHR